MNKSELKPLEVNGITAVTLGTFVWFITLVALFFSRDWLADTNRGHWIWISSSGLVLGLFGYRYTTNRAKRIGDKNNDDQSSLIHDFE